MRSEATAAAEHKGNISICFSMTPDVTTPHPKNNQFNIR